MHSAQSIVEVVELVGLTASCRLVCSAARRRLLLTTRSLRGILQPYGAQGAHGRATSAVIWN